jgi:hypothetical protein
VSTLALEHGSLGAREQRLTGRHQQRQIEAVRESDDSDTSVTCSGSSSDRYRYVVQRPLYNIYYV